MAVDKCRILRYINLSGNGVSGRTLALIAPAIFAGRVQVLDACQNPLGLDFMHSLADSAAAAATSQGSPVQGPQQLILADAHIGGDSMQRLMTLMRSTNGLQGLALQHNSIGSEGLYALSLALAAYGSNHLQALQTLDLSGNMLPRCAWIGGD